MFSTQVMQLTQEALWLILVLAGPPVVVASVVGILIALVQAATQLQEQTFQFTAKLFAIVFTIFVTASMLGGSLYHFSNDIFTNLPALAQ